MKGGECNDSDNSKITCPSKIENEDMNSEN